MTLDVDWQQLYKNVGLNKFYMDSAQSAQLRFYNIITKIYGFQNIIRLVQYVAVHKNANFYGKTIYIPSITALVQVYNKDFANPEAIINDFNNNTYASDSIINTSVHEYAHSLCCYIQNSLEHRKSFNSYSANRQRKESKQKQSNYLLSKAKLSNVFFQNIFSDPTQVFIDFVNNKNNVDTSDPIKQTLFPLMTVNGKYSKTGWIENSVEKREELLAEAFSLWVSKFYLRKNRAWEIVDDFFRNYFPNYYHLN